MKKILLCFLSGTILWSCNNDKGTSTTSTTDSSASTMDNATKSTVDLPFKASYTTNWTTDMSDADLKMVLMTYKDWSDGNISGLTSAMADTVTLDMATGDHKVLPNADLMKMWTIYRDSLSSVKISMDSWQKMYAPDKKEGYIVTWYDETDTYKNGKVDSASYHDINQVKNGKIVWYSTYKRPKK